MSKQVACLAAAVLIAALATPSALAQEKESRIGVVDMAKVLDGYKEFKESDDAYKTFLRERQGQLQERMGVRLLNAEELKEYQNLQAVVAPTEEQKKRIEELRAAAQAREDELTALQRAENPTEEQKKRQAELQALADQSKDEITKLQEKLAEEVNQRNKELSEKLNQKIETALQAVAKEKRVDFILSKDAVLYGGRDLTDAVLAKLNASG